MTFNYIEILIKLALGLVSLVFVINVTGKGNLAPNSAIDQIQNYVLGGIIGGVIYNKIYQNIKNDFAEQNDINQVLTSFSDELQAQVVEFNKLTESNKLYERIIGTSETDAPDKLSRLVMSSQIFQTEVGQYVNTNGANLLNGSKGPFKPDKKPANFDNNILVFRRIFRLWSTKIILTTCEPFLNNVV